MSAHRNSRFDPDSTGKMARALSPAELAVEVHRQKLVHTTTGGEAIAVVRRIFDEIEVELAKVIGVNGYRAMVTHCVRKISRHRPCLHPLCAEQASSDLDGLCACLQQQQPPVIEEAGVALLTACYELLTTLIGYDLTFRIFRETWPEAVAGAYRRGP